ncbi:MAG TPA: response regulator transcription factor [Acidimicrobiales bacterium]|nr:response regulator transcription factor [Acidimicrobiales bacterium]
MDVGTEPAPRILVVDDDRATRTLLRRLLTTEGYTVDEAADGASAVEMVEAGTPDLLLLDVMMPDQDGLEVLERLRRTSDVPIILLTAKGDEADRVLGFRFGADDYVVKPFSSAELAGRIAAVLRRTGALRPSTSRLGFDGLHIDLAKREVEVDGHPVDLPAREYEVLAFLASSPGQTFSRQQLLDELWPGGADTGEGTVTEHVGRLRRRIEVDPERPRWLRTVRGVGYRFDA